MKKLTTEEFMDRCKAKFGKDKYNYNEVEYVNNLTKVKIYCNTCKTWFEKSPSSMMNYGQGCPNCGTKRGSEKLSLKLRSTKEDFIKLAEKKHGVGKYDYSKVEFINYHTKVLIGCKKHNIFFKQEPNSHIHGSGCPICGNDTVSNKLTMSKNEFIKKAQSVFGKDAYDYSKMNYINTRKKVLIGCKICGKWFEVKPTNHVYGKNGCPYCSSSKGEKAVLRILENNNIRFTNQKRFICCRDKYPLPFDFYLPEYNLAIEYDGIQHYKPVSVFGADAGLKATQYRDNIKTNYCYDNDIILCRIRYDENIYSELSKYIELKEIEHG